MIYLVSNNLSKEDLQSQISGKQQPQQRGFAITVLKKVEPTPIPGINPIPPTLAPSNNPFKTPLPLR